MKMLGSIIQTSSGYSCKHTPQPGGVEWNFSMLLGLYNAELRKTCLTFMPKEIKHEREIKAILDHQLVNLRTYNMDPRAPVQDMAGLHSTYGYDRSETSKANKMLKTGQVPMDVNAMPGLVEDMSEILMLRVA